MNKAEFMASLRRHLKDLPEKDLSDILTDYEEHFRIGLQEGRTEEELAASLGSPEELAKEIRAVHFVRTAEDTRSANNLTRAIIATIGLGIFNIVVVLVPFLILVGILVAIFLTGAGFAIGGPLFLLFAVAPVGVHPAAGVLFVLGFVALGLLIIIGDYYVARAFYTIGVRYLKWNIDLIAGRA